MSSDVEHKDYRGPSGGWGSVGALGAILKREGHAASTALALRHLRRARAQPLGWLGWLPRHRQPDRTGNPIGLQAGFDILRTQPYAGGHRDHAGVYVAYTDYNAPSVSGFAVGQPQRVGRLLMSGPAVGAYWTHFGPSGWYLDAVFQANWFDVTARSDFGAGISTNGTGYAASLEAGYPIRFGQADRWQIEPQAQVIWQSVSIDRARDQFSSVDGTRMTR